MFKIFKSNSLFSSIVKISVSGYLFILTVPWLPLLYIRFLNYVVGDTFTKSRMVFSIVGLILIAALIIKIIMMLLFRLFFMLSKLLESSTDLHSEIDLDENKNSKLENHSIWIVLIVIFGLCISEIIKWYTIL